MLLMNFISGQKSRSYNILVGETGVGSSKAEAIALEAKLVLFFFRLQYTQGMG